MGGQDQVVILDAVPQDVLLQEQGMQPVILDTEPQKTTEEMRRLSSHVIWRDKLCINIEMDACTLLDKLSKFFDEVKSFELDPNTNCGLSIREQNDIRVLVDRALNWLVAQIAFENMPPVKLTLTSPGEYPDIVLALQDDRNTADVKELIETAKAYPDDELQATYLTPHFLKQFDLQGINDRMYLRARIRFSSALLGFSLRVYYNRFKDNQHYVSCRCMVGCLIWHRKMQSTGKPFPKFRRCTFFVQYKRPYCEQTGQRGDF